MSTLQPKETIVSLQAATRTTIARGLYLHGNQKRGAGSFASNICLACREVRDFVRNSLCNVDLVAIISDAFRTSGRCNDMMFRGKDESTYSR
jgi:hypothetical protein